MTPATPPATPLVTVLTSKFLRAGDRALRVPLGKALSHTWEKCDAHAQLAIAAGPPMRLAQRHLGAVEIWICTVAIDVDAEDHYASAEWWQQERPKVSDLLAALPGLFISRSRGGYKIWAALREPFRIVERADAAEYRDRYLSLLDDLEHHFGIAADTACADWQRLWRLPSTRRDGVLQSPDTIGDPLEIGSIALPELRWHRGAAAHSLAELGAHHRTRRFGAPSHASSQEFLSDADDRGALYDMLSARGMIVRRSSRLGGAHEIVCPRQRFHTTGSPGDGSTILIEPFAFGDPGLITCRHAHCAGIRGARDWKNEIELMDRAGRRGASMIEAAPTGN